MAQSRLLIIEDQADTRFFLERSLTKHFQVEAVENAIIGLERARAKPPDLILLDVMLPVLSGWDACKLLLQDPRTHHVPVLFLSAKGTPKDIGNGLSLGAEDYIKKPFDLPELVARIEARIERARRELSNQKEIQIKDLKLIPGKREVWTGAKRVELTEVEFKLLYFFILNMGRMLNRSEIWSGVWKEPLGKKDQRTIDVHIRALRKKVPVLEKLLKAVYGKGYVFNEA